MVYQPAFVHLEKYCPQAYGLRAILLQILLGRALYFIPLATFCGINIVGQFVFVAAY